MPLWTIWKVIPCHKSASGFVSRIDASANNWVQRGSMFADEIGATGVQRRVDSMAQQGFERYEGAYLGTV